MKKFSSVLLLMIISLFFITACSSGDKETSGKSTDDKNKKEQTVTLYITRHGKTMLNTSDRVQGWADSPLTEPGVEVAEDLGAGLEGVKFVSAYSSDSGRAIETAKLILENNGQKDLELKQNKDLREWNFGKYEGDYNHSLWGDVAKELKYPSMEALMSDTKNFSLETSANTIAKLDETKQAEDWKTISSRVKSAIDKISEETADKGGGNVLVVSHGLTINALIEDLDPSKNKIGLENASVTKVIYKDGKYTVETVGDMSYVEKGKEKRK